MAITAKITDASRALHVLDGMLKGISCDNKIELEELKTLKSWLDNHKNYSHIYPFCDAYEFVERIIEDGEITQGEQDELLDFCESFQALNGPIDLLTMEMRNLHGFLHGIIADKEITVEELKSLEKWMLYHDSNNGKWPFDEIYKLITRILKDGIVTKSEQEEFIEFAKGFIESEAFDVPKDKSIFVNQWMQTDAPILNTIDSIVNRNIEIIITGKSFCFTGQMKHGKRKDIQSILASKGGFPIERITKTLDYLVIGALSNPCWAYSTYGRKIEAIMDFNRKGGNSSIIHEEDFINKLNSI